MIDYGENAAHAATEAEKRKHADAAGVKLAIEVWRESLDSRRDGVGEGHWALTRADPDAPFSRPELSDTALTAAVWATLKFDRQFPGWQLYRRIMVGYEAFDAELLEWATGCAWALARAKTRNGRDYLRADARGPWIAWAAADAMYCVIYGRYPVRAAVHDRIRGVRGDTYRKVRDPVAAGMLVGLETFRSELHYQYRRAGKAGIGENACNTRMIGRVKQVSLQVASAIHDPDPAGVDLTMIHSGDGNFWTRPEPLHG